MLDSLKLSFCRPRGVVCNADLHGIRIILSLSALCTSFTAYFGGAITLPKYAVMLRVLPPQIWGTTFLIFAVVQLLVVILEAQNKTWTVFFSACMSLLWMFTSFTIFYSMAPGVTAIPIETALAIGSAWVFIRSGTHVIS